VRCFVVAGFLLTSASRGPSAIAEPLVNLGLFLGALLLSIVVVFFLIFNSSTSFQGRCLFS